MKRSRPPRRKRGLPRSSRRIRSRKADPAKRRFANLRSAAFQAWIRELPCVISGCPRNLGCSGPIECAHVKARSTGGADIGNCLPMCRRHHANQHAWGIKTFARFYDIAPEKLARALGEVFRGEAA